MLRLPPFLSMPCRRHRGCCSPPSCRNLPPPEFSPPRCGSSRAKIQAAASPAHALRPFRCSIPFRAAAYPATTAYRKEISYANSPDSSRPPGRRLRALGKIADHFFRNGMLGLKLAVKIPFFIEIAIAFETDWNRRR
jgi:hypothetical protein